MNTTSFSRLVPIFSPLGFRRHCHCHHSTDKICLGWFSCTPCQENNFLNSIHAVIALLEYLFLKKTVD